MNGRALVVLVGCGLGAALLAPSSVGAQADPGQAYRPPPAEVVPPQQEARTLAGHRFIPFHTVVYAPITTRVGTTTDATFTSIDIAVDNPFDPEGPPITRLDGKIAVVTESFQFSIAVARWFGLRAKLIAGVASGIDRDGALEIGANGTYGGELGGALRLFRTKRAMLTFDFVESVVNLQGLQPRLLLDSLPSQGEPVSSTSLQLVYDGRAVSSVPSLALAVALGRVVGLQMSGSYSRTRYNTSVVNGHRDFVQGALGLSLAAGPISILAGGRVLHEFRDIADDSPLSSIEPRDDTRGEAEAALYYSGRPELDLGVRTTYVVGKTDRRYLGGLSLAYYW